jgi:small-conductance mechanosensitive channel
MKFSPQLALAAIGVATLLAGATGASAETHWQQHHPRRVEVNHRLNNQNRRINTERREGDITRAQARDLHQEDRGIRAQERFDASHDRGHITRAEKRRLNHEENGVSGQIGR